MTTPMFGMKTARTSVVANQMVVVAIRRVRSLDRATSGGSFRTVRYTESNAALKYEGETSDSYVINISTNWSLLIFLKPLGSFFLSSVRMIQRI